jgi:uncharacterized membrane protein
MPHAALHRIIYCERSRIPWSLAAAVFSKKMYLYKKVRDSVMRVISFATWRDRKDALGLETVERLIFNNEPQVGMFLLNLAELNFVQTESRSPDKGESPLRTLVQPSKIVLDGQVSLPDLWVEKAVVVFDPAPYCITDASFLATAVGAEDVVRRVLERAERDVRRLFRVLYDLRPLVTFVDFYKAYDLVDAADVLLRCTWTYYSLAQDLSRLPSPPRQRISQLGEAIATLSRSIEQTRHSTMQRIAYLDSGTSRILTIVATIFLPAAFLVALFSMPLRGVPLRDAPNAYWIFFGGLMVLFVALIAVFRKDFSSVFRKKQ